jgi:hypothetical protein
MECSLGQALQDTLAILAKVRPADLNPGLAAGLLRQARLAVVGACRGPDGQALFGPARRGSCRAGPGPAGHLAAFLGRVV